MRRTLFAIAGLALVTLAACTKEEDIDKIPDRGSVRYINRSANLYRIFLDDQPYGELYGDDTALYPKVIIGAHRVKALQIADIVDTPKLRQETVVVQKDSVATFVFP